MPGPLRELVERAGRHQTVTLSAGLAFFGIISLAPALGLGLALLQLLWPPEAVAVVIETLRGTFAEALGLSALMEQVQGQAGSYLGLSLLIVLWPATTLASGWARALDAVGEDETPPALRGLTGRIKGLGLGLGMLAGLDLVIAAVTAGTIFAGGRAVALGGVVVLVVALVFVTCLALYRWFPARRRRPWSSIWPGAAWATAGVCVATVGFALALQLAGSLARRYPPALSTAVVVGLWLYAANACLLLGDEWNLMRGR
ncbi:MAG: YihY/virulence factor BrkB family protein [Actinomycetota bacterium]|nr:YihY/virulence factor BrkB family protein [Actinomycetota bacterium]